MKASKAKRSERRRQKRQQDREYKCHDCGRETVDIPLDVLEMIHTFIEVYGPEADIDFGLDPDTGEWKVWVDEYF